MKKKTRIGTLVLCTVTLALLAVDLITKAFAEWSNVRQAESFLGIVRLWYDSNPGIAFGIAADNPVGMIAITALTVLLILGIGVLFFTVFKKNNAVRACLAVIEAGAVGNLLDRICLGYVRDFVDVRGFRPFAWLGSNFNFGICNIADFYITFGAVALVIIILFIGPKAVFPLTKKWRKEAKELDAEKELEKERKRREKVDRLLASAGYTGFDAPSEGPKPSADTTDAPPSDDVGQAKDPSADTTDAPPSDDVGQAEDPPAEEKTSASSDGPEDAQP